MSCPHCQSVCQLQEQHTGQTALCPNCRKPFPAQPASQEKSNGVSPGPVDGNGQLARELTRSRLAPAGEERLRSLSLERVPGAWVDRLLPARPWHFLGAVAVVALGCWLVGLVLAGNPGGFLRSREWQVQPIFLAVHFICLRLFVTCYTRNFLAGAARMDLPEGEAARRVRQVLGPVGGACALLAAVPFCISNLFYLSSGQYADEAAVFGGGTHAAVDWFLFVVWCVEWAINAYIWMLLVGFLWLTMRTLWYSRFRASIDVVLHEKHYRPFLLMSAQGASVVLFFAIVNSFYVWYAAGVLSDLIGLAITMLLLLVGFGPPWLQLKAGIERQVDAEMFGLQQKLIENARRRAEVGTAGQPATLEEVTARLDEALAILRGTQLERMHRELGRAEGRALLLKLLAPASALAWKVLRPFLLPG
jgi:hypothetical protein